MIARDLVPHLTGGAVLILGGFLVLAIGVALFMGWADHVATQWAADQYEAGQSPTEGQLPPRTLSPRIPQQRRPDQDAS